LNAEAAIVSDRPPSRLRKTLLWLAAIAAVIAIGGYLALRFSPWPSALLIRQYFDAGGVATARALEKHVPHDVAQHLNLSYEASERDALLDVFHPADIDASERLTTIVWIHGGGWLAGSKDQIANWARIIAGHGYTAVGVDYSMAPGATYPTPVRQANAALGWLVSNSARLHIDPSHLFIAGDSAGAQVAAQLANLVSVASYAQALHIEPSIRRDQLRGVILFCGAYDLRQARPDGSFGYFVASMLWSYSGTREYSNDPRFATASVAAYVDPVFPPTFISAGNADPLAPQSVAFAQVLEQKGVTVDKLFFARGHEPALAHEYQFELDTEDGKRALQRMLEFIAAH
jgi:acetyl esterase/lipase